MKLALLVAVLVVVVACGIASPLEKSAKSDKDKLLDLLRSLVAAKRSKQNNGHHGNHHGQNHHGPNDDFEHMVEKAHEMLKKMLEKIMELEHHCAPQLVPTGSPSTGKVTPPDLETALVHVQTFLQNAIARYDFLNNASLTVAQLITHIAAANHTGARPFYCAVFLVEPLAIRAQLNGVSGFNGTFRCRHTFNLLRNFTSSPTTQTWASIAAAVHQAVRSDVGCIHREIVWLHSTMTNFTAPHTIASFDPNFAIALASLLGSHLRVLALDIHLLTVSIKHIGGMPGATIPSASATPLSGSATPPVGGSTTPVGNTGPQPSARSVDTEDNFRPQWAPWSQWLV